MSWEDIMRRVLPPTKGVPPHITSPYGEVEERPPGSSKPHPAADFNYFGGQAGINLQHPALRSPVGGIVTKAGQDKWGTIAIRDANGFSHEILHTQGRYVAVGDPVAEGQLIGTMGNTGTKDQHVHYQLKDPAGNTINPTEFWDQQGPANPNPDPPAYLEQYQQYLRSRDDNTGTGLSNAPATAPSDESAPPDAAADIRLLRGRVAGQSSISPSDVNSFDDRFGNWTSSPAGSVPLNLPQPATSPAQFVIPDQLNSPGGLAGWIAALAGIDPQNPDQPAPSPIDDQLRVLSRTLR